MIFHQLQEHVHNQPGILLLAIPRKPTEYKIQSKNDITGGLNLFSHSPTMIFVPMTVPLVVSSQNHVTLVPIDRPSGHLAVHPSQGSYFHICYVQI